MFLTFSRSLQLEIEVLNLFVTKIVWVKMAPSVNFAKLLVVANCALAVAAEPKVVSLPIHKNQRRSIVKRDHASATLENDFIDGLFLVNATVGTPGQQVQLQIDTGSSDIWMFGARSCAQAVQGCIGGSCKYQEPSPF